MAWPAPHGFVWRQASSPVQGQTAFCGASSPRCAPFRGMGRGVGGRLQGGVPPRPASQLVPSPSPGPETLFSNSKQERRQEVWLLGRSCMERQPVALHRIKTEGKRFHSPIPTAVAGSSHEGRRSEKIVRHRGVDCSALWQTQGPSRRRSFPLGWRLGIGRGSLRTTKLEAKDRS